MIYIGLDMGMSAVKAVLINEDGIIGSHSRLTEEESETAARHMRDHVLQANGLAEADVVMVAATGMGRKEVSFAGVKRTEQVCLARGAGFLFPTVKTVLDTGAGGCRALRLGDGGKLLDFALNSKCAGGTGSFIEAAGRVLQIDLERLDQMAMEAETPARVSSYCAVFAESEIISNIHRGFPMAAICAGICESIMQRMLDVMRRVGTRRDVLLCGGVARNRTIVEMFNAQLDTAVMVPEEPVMVGALGAALIGRDLAQS